MQAREIVYVGTKAGGIICHDLRCTFATHLAQTETTFKICSAPCLKVYARATLTVLEDTVDKITEPWGEVIKFEQKVS